jgi:hypothetical protein
MWKYLALAAIILVFLLWAFDLFFIFGRVRMPPGAH